MSKWMDVVQATKALAARALPGADVRGLDNAAAKPTRIPPNGLAIVRPGSIGEPEVDLSPLEAASGTTARGGVVEQDLTNRSLGQYEGSARASAMAFRELFAEQEASERAALKLRAAIDPLFAAEQQLARALAEVTQAEKAGTASAELLTEARRRAHAPQRNADNMQAVTNAIRARTPALNRIIFPGCDYSSAERWVSNGNADALEKTYDPAGNIVYEVHCYWDDDGSGTKPNCKSGARNRLAAPTAWAKRTGKRLFLGETGSGDPTVAGQQQCAIEVTGAYQLIYENTDAWWGMTPYFGGDMWGQAFPFVLDPASYTDPVENARLKMLLPYLTVSPA